MEINYHDQAVACVKEHVLPIQRELFEKAGRDFDVFYNNFNETDMYFGSVIESKKVYELGYRKCTCQKVLDGSCTDPMQCECSRQSILYILNELAPERHIDVEIIETILRGGESCRFRITIE